MSKNCNKVNWSIPHYVDTSIAVKLVVTEDQSDRLRDYFIKNWSYHFHITEFAFYETLSVLKRKLKKKEIDEKGYHACAFQLAAYIKDDLLQIDSDFRLDNFKVLYEVGEFVDKYSLDYSDALQIYTVLYGQWRGKHAECMTIFVTADNDLAEAAKHEGLRVWNPLKEIKPPGI